MKNYSNAPVWVHFQGPVWRDLLVQKGSNKFILPIGRYDYRYTACGIQFSGKIDVQPMRVLRIAPCATTKLVIKNFTNQESPGSSLTLRLTGPVNYYFVITKPAENLTVQQGLYEFSLRGCGKVIDSGTIDLQTSRYKWSIHCPP